jgi:hypothetical protein
MFIVVFLLITSKRVTIQLMAFRQPVDFRRQISSMVMLVAVGLVIPGTWVFFDACQAFLAANVYSLALILDVKGRVNLLSKLHGTRLVRPSRKSLNMLLAMCLFIRFVFGMTFSGFWLCLGQLGILFSV